VGGPTEDPSDVLSAERSSGSHVTSREVRSTKTKWVTVCGLEAATNITTKESESGPVEVS
jgi:hypothetical protein